VREWVARAEALVTEVNVALEALAATTRRLDRLTETARSLRDDANGLLVEHEAVLVGSMYDRLVELDVDNDVLPTDVIGLESWISQAETTIAAARKSVTQAASGTQGVDSDALASLAARFNTK
jgi:ABC-type transporter Mla subunit MlaD